ncbi:hypothetical protein AAG570_002959 [Ranatra chinensis]|uniref:Uncharacterized protein n=1 Tax=Ranatra chinensis TaxID=642074 RepID=A0ABD0YJP4_9HEMI
MALPDGVQKEWALLHEEITRPTSFKSAWFKGWVEEDRENTRGIGVSFKFGVNGFEFFVKDLSDCGDIEMRLVLFTCVVLLANVTVLTGGPQYSHLSVDEFHNTFRVTWSVRKDPILADKLHQENDLSLKFNIHSPDSIFESSVGKKSPRLKRQRKVHNQPGFLFLLAQLFTGTVTDTNIAIRNITQIVNEQFPSSSAQTLGLADDNRRPGGRLEGANSTRLTIQDLANILGRNFRGLRRLFNSEWRNAIMVRTTWITFIKTVIWCSRAASVSCEMSSRQESSTSAGALCSTYPRFEAHSVIKCLTSWHKSAAEFHRQLVKPTDLRKCLQLG